jgi:hypothetical protein
MRAFVFTDKSLARHAGRFVWLEIDRENAKNSEFRRRFPLAGLPTFTIVDPVREVERVRWVGGLTVSQLHALLDDISGAGDTPRALLIQRARADSLYGVPDYAAAAPAYESVLASAPEDWPQRSLLGTGLGHRAPRVPARACGRGRGVRGCNPKACRGSHVQDRRG